jgi:DNA-binding transcriptional ArsR family regulator
MVRFTFAADDLLRTRFAISPLMELVGALYARRDPDHYWVHQPWTRWVLPRTAHLDLELLELATPRSRPFYPVFLAPPPRTPHAEIRDELERVRATPPDRVAAEVARAYPEGVPAAGRLLITDPARALDLLVNQMRAFWEAALAPWWDRISANLEAEIAWRARRLAAIGPGSAFTGLHETVRWREGALEVHPTRKAPADVDLAGRGITLLPAVFTWPSVWPRSDPPWDPALVYPPPGISELWAPESGGYEALAALVGRGRARILLELDRPASTLELARRVDASAGGVSEHLSILRRAGLVCGRREGRRVVYARTAKGEALCAPGALDGSP